jgi:hypothetical protein
MKRIAIAIASIALLVAAAPATAKPKAVYYDGKTVDGNSLSFAMAGNRIFDIEGYVTTTCVPTHGTPTVSPGEFNPPGGFVIGKTTKASNTEFISYRGDVTKNYTIGVKKLSRRVWTADLHVNYSYEEVIPSGVGELEKLFYICQGDDEFRFVV